MTDLLHVLPDFPVKHYTHLIPSLEKHLVTTSDLLTLDALEIGKRAQLPLLDLRRLINEVISQLHGQLGFDSKIAGKEKAGQKVSKNLKNNTEQEALYTPGRNLSSSLSTISTLDPGLDAALGGGIPTRYITEITGERYPFFFIPHRSSLSLIPPSVVPAKLNSS